jgi:DNA-binding transcriptional LysR family regulator
MDWDDVRLFLSVARTGTSRAAAKDLGIDQSTVSRRLKRFEQDAGVQFFERDAGLHLTEAGHEMLDVAERIESEFALLARQVLGRDTRLSGRIRVSIPDFMVAPLAPIVSDFGQRYPGITLEMRVDNGYVNLTHREADVALRLGTTAPDFLVGRRIASAPAAIYGAPPYLARQPSPINPSTLEWISWEEAWRTIPPERWIAANVPPAQVRARVNTNHAIADLVAAGLGVAFMLCYTGDADARVCRVGEPFDFGLSLWLLTHEDVRRTARIAAFMRFVGDALASERATIEGADDA